MHFAHAGFQCRVATDESGSLCAYVAVPYTHPLHGEYYDEEACEDIKVGRYFLTYSAPAGGAWEFGLDCRTYDSHTGGHTVEFMRARCCELAEELAKRMPAEERLGERIERLRCAAEEYEALRETVLRITKAFPDGVSLRSLSVFAEAKRQIGRAS